MPSSFWGGGALGDFLLAIEVGVSDLKGACEGDVLSGAVEFRLLPRLLQDVSAASFVPWKDAAETS